MLSAGVLACLCVCAAAGRPAAGFPNFIPLSSNKVAGKQSRLFEPVFKGFAFIPEPNIGSMRHQVRQPRNLDGFCSGATAQRSLLIGFMDCLPRTLRIKAGGSVFRISFLVSLGVLDERQKDETLGASA